MKKYLTIFISCTIVMILIMLFIVLKSDLYNKYTVNFLIWSTISICFTISLIIFLILSIYNVFGSNECTATTFNDINTTIVVTIPAGSNSPIIDNMEHKFVYVDTPSAIPGLLIDQVNPKYGLILIQTENPVPAGTVGNIIGYVVPLGSYNQPISNLSGQTMGTTGPNNSCNTTYACGAINLSGVITPAQYNIIKSYTPELGATLPSCTPSSPPGPSCTCDNRTSCEIDYMSTNPYYATSITVSGTETIN
jgi:hypothetical protein